MKPKKNRRTKWTFEEREKLKNLFEEFDGDIVKISTKLRRGERSVRMNLFFMGLISEGEVDNKLIKHLYVCPKVNLISLSPSLRFCMFQKLFRIIALAG